MEFCSSEAFDNEIDEITNRSLKTSIENFKSSHKFGPDLAAFKLVIENSLNELSNSIIECKLPKILFIDDNDFNRTVIGQTVFKWF